MSGPSSARLRTAALKRRVQVRLKPPGPLTSAPRHRSWPAQPPVSAAWPQQPGRLHSRSGTPWPRPGGGEGPRHLSVQHVPAPGTNRNCNCTQRGHRLPQAECEHTALPVPGLVPGLMEPEQHLWGRSARPWGADGRSDPWPRVGERWRAASGWHCARCCSRGA